MTPIDLIMRREIIMRLNVRVQQKHPAILLITVVIVLCACGAYAGTPGEKMWAGSTSSLRKVPA
jgi:hypothetical protein